jgi:hypothetical protein
MKVVVSELYIMELRQLSEDVIALPPPHFKLCVCKTAFSLFSFTFLKSTHFIFYQLIFIKILHMLLK